VEEQHVGGRIQLLLGVEQLVGEQPQQLRQRGPECMATVQLQQSGRQVSPADAPVSA
jgi:hypothetical protein